MRYENSHSYKKDSPKTIEKTNMDSKILLCIVCFKTEYAIVTTNIHKELIFISYFLLPTDANNQTERNKLKNEFGRSIKNPKTDIMNIPRYNQHRRAKLLYAF